MKHQSNQLHTVELVQNVMSVES